MDEREEAVAPVGEPVPSGTMLSRRPAQQVGRLLHIGPYGVANSGWQRNSRPKTKEIARAPGRRLARHQAEPEHPGRRARRVEDLETAAVLPDRAEYGRKTRCRVT